MIKAVIFDMDGVIIDSEMGYLEDLYGFARAKKADLKIEELYGTVGTTKQDCWKVVAAAVGTGETWEELREEFRRWGKVPYRQRDYRAMFRPQILEVMDELRDRGYRLAVASSTSLEMVDWILGLNHVKERLELMVSGGMFKRSKPDPEIYLYTAHKLGVQPEECFVVEDSTVGITAASRAGMTVAALIDNRFGFDRSLADYEMERLEEIVPLVVKCSGEERV